jgi:hypothetical protein
MLEMKNKCRNDQCPTPQECEGNSLNHKREVEPAQKKKKKIDNELNDQYNHQKIPHQIIIQRSYGMNI